MPIVIGNPCDAGSVSQALPIKQGRESMDSRNLNHGHAICADNLSFTGLRSVNRGVGVGVMGDMGRGSVGSWDEIGHTVALARGARGGLMDTVSITVEHVGRFLPLMVGWSTISESVIFGGTCSERVNARCLACIWSSVQ